MERIVVGVDGSANSRRALAWAAGEAHDRDAEMVIVHAWMLPAAAHGSLISPNFDIEGTKKSYRDAARGTVAAMLRSVDLDGVRHEVRIIEGLPGPALVDSSSDAAAIVVGHRGRGRLAEFVLGSTAQHVSRHAAVPVVVVPDDARVAASAA